MVQINSTTWFTTLALLASALLTQAAPSSKVCVVQKSKTDDAVSITQAFKDCQNGGTVVFSKGTTYYPKSLMDIRDLNNVNVQFFGNMVLPDYNTKFNGGSAYLEIRGNNIHFDGNSKGTIIGSGQQWWDAKNNQGPIVLRITAKDSVFTNFRILDAPNGHMALTGCDNVVVEKIYIHSVSKTKNFAYNTDAWGCAWSKNLIFRDSVITNGDDCAAINGGVSNITVSNVKCNGSHGFSIIGALATDGRYQTFDNINIVDSTCNNCLNGVQLKASPGRPGKMDGINFKNIQLNNVENPIIMTTHYFCDEYHTSACYKNDGTSIKFTNVKFQNITGSTSWKDLPVININCAPNTPCGNVSMSNINIRKNSSTKKNVCINLKGAGRIPYCKQ
ncbi:unnamed protein product [Mucor hiemalis]